MPGPYIAHTHKHKQHTQVMRSLNTSLAFRTVRFLTPRYAPSGLRGRIAGEGPRGSERDARLMNGQRSAASDLKVRPLFERGLSSPQTREQRIMGWVPRRLARLAFALAMRRYSCCLKLVSPPLQSLKLISKMFFPRLVIL